MRSASSIAARPAARGRAAGPAPEPCGERGTARRAASGIAHDSQTEGYYIVSGAGTMVTGGHIMNGRKSAPDAEVTRVLNGPSCSGTIMGADGHVLSFRASDHILEAGYVHPSIKK